MTTSLRACRPWTEDRHDPLTGILTVTLKRICNGCGVKLGDVTSDELDAAVLGRRLPDVREECGCLEADLDADEVEDPDWARDVRMDR